MNTQINKFNKNQERTVFELFSDTFKETRVTQNQSPELNQEADISIIPPPPKISATTAADINHTQGCLNAVEDGSTPSKTEECRTKEEKAKNGTRSSLAYLSKMAKRDPATFSPRERYLIRKHKQGVAKFERIYGPTSVILGKSIPKELLMFAEGNSSGPPKKGREEESHNTEPKTVPPERSLVTGKESAAPPTFSKPVDSKQSNFYKRPQPEVIKRARSADDQPSTSKKVKKSMNIDSNHMAVIDRKDPNGRISTELWQKVEAELIDSIAAFEGNSEELSFKGAGWLKGVKIVNCGNRKSIDFLKSVIGKIGKLYPDLKLEVINASELTVRTTVVVWIPPPIRPVETILQVLSKQNKTLSTDQWKYITSLDDKDKKGKDFRFAVDHESYKELERLGGVVNFGLGTVRFRLMKSSNSETTKCGADKSATQ